MSRGKDPNRLSKVIKTKCEMENSHIESLFLIIQILDIMHQIRTLRCATVQYNILYHFIQIREDFLLVQSADGLLQDN